MTTLQDIMGLISKRKIKTPTDKDYIISAAYTDTQEVLKPQPKMEASLINVGALKKFIANGTQGPAGPQGQQGIQGPQGVQGVQGEQGIQGETGAALTVLGSYPNLGSFLAGAGNSPGEPGTAWIIESDGSLYVWNTLTNTWEDVGDLQGPQGIQGIQGIQGEQGIQGVQGIQGISGTSGLETSIRYSPTFTATGMTFTGSGTTYPTYNSYYVKSGLLVSFVIEIDFTTVTNFGTGQYKVALPFAPAFGYNHFSGWIWADPNVDPDTGTGHTILNADTAGITTVLDLHYLKSAGGANAPIREGLWKQTLPVDLTTISKAYINGTYISTI
jgi:hypothetical protein